jgi:hypothetical protein
MRKLFIILMMFGLYSCKNSVSFQEYLATEYKFNNTGQEFFSTKEDKGIYLVSNINGVVDTLLFDTGYTGIFFYAQNINGVEDINDLKSKTYTTPTEKVKFPSKKVNGISINNDLLSINNHTCVVNYYEKSKSDDKKHSILGFSLIQENNIAVKLSYSENKLYFFDTNKIDTDGYFEVKSDFNPRRLYVYITIDGREYKCLFDTGNSGNLLLDKKNFKYHNDSTCVEFEGALIANIKQLYFSPASIKLKFQYDIGESRNNLGYNLLFLKGVKKNNIGNELISRYDWIIDSRNKKLYAKEIKDSTNIMIEELARNIPKLLKTDGFTCKAMEYNGKLTIVLKAKSNEKYKLMSVIKSVNGEIITHENISYYSDLLSKTIDWSTLNLVFE